MIARHLPHGAVAQQGEHTAVMRDAGHAMRPRQWKSAGEENGYGQQRDDGEDGERCGVAVVIDRKAGNQRSDKAGHRVAECQQAEIARPFLGTADFAGRPLRRELEQHERHPDDGGADAQRPQTGRDERHRNTCREPDRAGLHRQADTDPVGQPARRDRGQHRQERVERHQEADREGGGALRQRRERNGDATSGKHRVARDPERYQDGEHPG